MKFLDKVKISQTNLLRSKLRTILTIGAIFIGTFTISLTNGVGNGIKSYVDQELGNVGAEGQLLVQAISDQENPLNTDVKEYDESQATGMYNIALVSTDDIANIKNINGVSRVVPMLTIRAEYISRDSEHISKQYQVVTEQFIEGLNLDMAAGRTLDNNSANQVNIPLRYVSPLGFTSANDAVGKTVSIAYKDVNGNMNNSNVSIVGVMQTSLLGNSSVYISYPLAQKINSVQTDGVKSLASNYQGVLVSYNPNFSEEEVEELKQLLNANNFSAQTFQDAIGTINTVIDGILMVLNVFSAIALIAATFGIVNTLFMAVTERTSEIGLMKALGANSRTIFAIFALEAASIGFWGALLGIGVSAGIAPIVNKIATDRFLKDFVGFELLAFPVGPSLIIFGGIILLAFLAGALPSIKASRLDPIKALRYE